MTIEHSVAILLHRFQDRAPASGRPNPDRPMRFDHAVDAIAHRFGGIKPDRHLGELMLDQSEFGNRFSESDPFFCIPDGLRQHVFCAADRKGPKLEAAEVQNAEGDDVATTDFAKDVLGRNLHVVEIDGTG